MNVKDLIQLLEKNQKNSNDSLAYERTVKEAFDFLGFQSEHFGGSGDTDVLITGNIGSETFKVNVEVKTSGTGRISETQINWPTLRDHKEKNKSDFILVVGPNFAGGNLEKRAKEYGVSLLPNDSLIDLLEAHSKFPFSLTDLKEIFLGFGDIQSNVSDIITQNNLGKAILENIGIVISEMETIQDRLGYFTFDSLAGREKFETLEIEPSEIKEIIEMLKLPYINAVKSLGQVENRLILGMKKRELSRLFKNISLYLEEQASKIPLEKKPKNLKKIATKYFDWEEGQKGKTIIAKARRENPYNHYCPKPHFRTILNSIVEQFSKENVVINVEIIFQSITGKELEPDRFFKGRAEEYKIRMVLGVLELEGLIKWTGSQRPVEYKLNCEIEKLINWANDFPG